MLWHLVYGAIIGDRRPCTIAEWVAAAKRVADMIERRAALPSTLKAAPTGELELVPHPSDKEIRRIAKTVRAPEPAASPDVAPGAVHDRDVNAALNIRRRGLATLGEGAVS